MGLVFVLLLGEIDLSAGFTSGVLRVAHDGATSRKQDNRGTSGSGSAFSPASSSA
jgi:hypothetical protein